MKNISFILIVAFLFTSCSKTVEEVDNRIGQRSEKNKSKTQTESVDIMALRQLLSSEAPNLALADFLAQSVSKDNATEANALIAELSVDEAKEIISKVQYDNKQIRDNHLYHHQSYQNNADLLSFSVLNTDSTISEASSIENELKISTFAYLKSKFMDEIIHTYDRRAKELALFWAENLALEIGQKEPGLSETIDKKLQKAPKDSIIEMIKSSKTYVERIDQYFKTSNLSEDEQYLLSVSAIIASAIYTKIRETKGFKNLLNKSKRFVQDMNELKRKANEFILLINTLENHLTKTEKDMKDFGDGLKGSREDVKSLFDEIRKGINGPSDIESERIVSFLYKKVISGEKIKNNGTNASILSRQVSFGENFNKTLKAAGSLSNNLENIINTTNRLSSLMGISLSEDVQKVLNKAQKVSALISTVQSTVAGFASGGFIGAMGALSSGPMMSLMGGGISQESIKLDEISKKLDIIIRGQQIMMEMQEETMTMIKDLALMVDIYHQREMAALSELRDYSLVDTELSKANLNKDIRGCERMINFQLRSVWKKMDFGLESFHSINNIDLINSRFNKSISGLIDVQRIVTSVEGDGFVDCQKGIAEAFGGTSLEENPLRLIFDSKDDSNLLKFQREKYSPLLRGLEKIANTGNFDGIPLHLPMKSVSGLQVKKHFIENPANYENTNDIYHLNQLISVKNLERYLNHLIILYPLLELDKSVWMTSYPEIVDTYIRNANIRSNQNTRSNLFLSNALKLVQSAIAQEAILAGEPLLHRIHESFVDDVFSNKDCDKIEDLDIPRSEFPYICSLRENKLLLKNLLLFTLDQENKTGSNFAARYKTAFDNSDASEMTKLLNLTDDTFKVEVDSGLIVRIQGFGPTKPVVTLKLPTPLELEEGKIIYSENMSRLLKMQHIILDGLEKVAPIKRDHSGKDLLKIFLIAA